MTPEQIDLARQAMALPGAPTFVWSGSPGQCRWREFETGILWICTGIRGENHLFAWLPKLTDAATGGALLSMLGADARRIAACISHHKRAAGLRWWADVAPGEGSEREVVADLAHACCLVAVAVGRWGPA